MVYNDILKILARRYTINHISIFGNVKSKPDLCVLEEIIGSHLIGEEEDLGMHGLEAGHTGAFCEFWVLLALNQKN